MTEIVGYDGPVLMTAPTRAMVPYMLEDFKRVVMDTREDPDKSEEKEMENENQEKKTGNKGPTYTSKDIEKCISKVSE